MRHAIAVLTLASFLAGVRQVAAQPVAHNERPPPAEAVPGEDEALYSCKQRTGQVVVTFKTDAEVKDLIAWVMGFTCKAFLLDPRVVATGRKISLLTPNKMTAADAYRVFLAAQTVLGQNIPSFAMLFRALAEQSNANIISSPSIIAVDNVEAKYKVGTTIQVSSGTTFVGVTAGAAPTGIGNSHVAPEELPLILNIKPHISNDNLVMLEVKHEAKELTGETALGPSWNTRSFETRVVVGDQQTIVLGGLRQDKETVEATKVPLLGDIPLLGYLFKTTVKRRHKTNLLVMLTPYIIRDQLDLRAIHERKLREHDELARSFSTLDHMKYEPQIDYRRKRGVVEEINRSVQDVEQEMAARGAVAGPRGVEAGSVELHPPAGS